MGEVVAAHAVMFFEVADDRLDSGAPFEVALDLRRDAALLAGRVDLELVIGRGVVAAIAGIGDAAIEHVTDERLHLGNDRGERVPVIRVSGQRGDVSDELPAGGMLHGGGDAHLDAELVGPVRLAFADALNLWRVQGIDLAVSMAISWLSLARQYESIDIPHPNPHPARTVRMASAPGNAGSPPPLSQGLRSPATRPRCRPECDDVSAVRLRAEDHDPVFADRRHRPRSLTRPP